MFPPGRTVELSAPLPYIAGMRLVDRKTHDRVWAVMGVAVFHVLLGYALIAGLTVRMPLRLADELKIFNITPPPPPPPMQKEAAQQPKTRKHEGKAAPPNLKSKATPVVAPTPTVRLQPPPTIIAAPKAWTANDASLGAAQRSGPGSGAGGVGNGTGSGDSGYGEGDGGGTPPRQIAGKIRNADYPKWAAEQRIGGTVSVAFRVETDGSVTHCSVTRSSGSARLDSYTCSLIEQRFHYRPSHDEQGRPVPCTVVEDHSWIVQDDPDPPDQR
jgi:periplasmic protein TonB